jgi:DNA helicase II / ATP-dependent DNA helicase PcrA
LDNLEELVNDAKGFTFEELPPDIERTGDNLLAAFIAKAALDAGDAQVDKDEDAVQLMTLHSAKGLEFPLVFIVGLEEGLFPHKMSADSLDGLEEERRLCYVGITRAREKLILTHAETRRLHGEENFTRPSRFIREIPPALRQDVRLKGQIQRAAAWQGSAQQASNATDGLRLGQRVRHASFGEGVVLSCEGNGQNARIQINFDAVGGKWLVAAYAKLEPL